MGAPKLPTDKYTPCRNEPASTFPGTEKAWANSQASAVNKKKISRTSDVK